MKRMSSSSTGSLPLQRQVVDEPTTSTTDGQLRIEERSFIDSVRDAACCIRRPLYENRTDITDDFLLSIEDNGSSYANLKPTSNFVTQRTILSQSSVSAETSNMMNCLKILKTTMKKILTHR